MDTPDFRALCAQLVGYLQGRKDNECGWPGEDPEQDLIDATRAALEALPASLDVEGLEAHFRVWHKARYESEYFGAMSLVTCLEWTEHAIACYGVPTPAPVPVAALNIVFDGPPGPEGGRFVEVETDDGLGINAGEWSQRPDGMWSLRITSPAPVPVAERLPEPSDCDEHGDCWWFEAGMDAWYIDSYQGNWTHWLPHWALPLPEPTK